jgi:FAS-associated factor 2
VAFIALHPVPPHLGGPSATHSGSSPRLTVLSRHEGSPSSKTSASTLTTHITTSLLPRVTPLLTRLRTEKWEREQERRLRDEQDRAFAEAAARDKERVLKRQAEERAAAQAARKAEEERQAKALRKANIAAWRRYARRALLAPEPKSDGVRIGIRMPDGKRFVRMFDRQDTAVNVYTFVETLFVPASDDPSSDPSEPPSGYGNCAEHEWTFSLVTSFPRKEIPPTKDVVLGTLPELKGGANLALEMRDTHDDYAVDSDDDRASDAESD